MRFREPLVIPFILFACGMAIQVFWPLPLRASLCSALALIAIAAVAHAISSKPLSFISAWFSVLFAGSLLIAVRPQASAPQLSVPDNQQAIFAGCVVDPALLATDRERFTVELAPHARAQVSLFAREGESFPDLPYGSTIEFQGKVRTPHNFNDPGTFDSAHFLARQQIYWSASGDAARLHTVPGKCGNPLSAFIFGVRQAALSRLDHLYPNDPYSNGMMQAVLIRATVKLDRMWTEDYRSTGTFHALVISGSHVAVLAAVLLFLLRIVAVPRALALFLTILIAWLYAGVTGWQAPVLRSAVGMSLYGLARCFYREGRILNILAAVAFFFVVIDPEQLFDASFQLSFLAVAAIGAFVIPALDATSSPLSRGLTDLSVTQRDLRIPPKTAQFRVEMRLLSRTLNLALHFPPSVANAVVTIIARVTLYLYEIFVTSFFIQVALALPMAIYFHRLSASGLTANAIVVPVLSAIVPLGFAAILTNSQTLAHLCAWLLDIARQAVGFHARWEPDWRIPGPPFWLAAAFVIALLLASLRRQPALTRATAWIAATALLCVIVFHPFAPAIQKGKFELTAIDVGQGDSLLAAFPNGKLMLIDTGGIPSFGRTHKAGIDIGEDVVSPYLWTRSIKHLDIVAMTHAHEDHMGGMSAVLKNFHPAELWTGAVAESPEWRRVREAASRLHIKIRVLTRTPAFPFNGTSLEILAPSSDYAPLPIAKNDDSLVLRIQYKDRSFLLTGDMEKKIEEQLFYEGLLQHNDVLKVGHHGSRTSTTPDLLDTVHPAFGIISAGFDNSYGHPHPLTLAALTRHNVRILRTDQQGLITILTDGHNLTISTATDAFQ